MKRLVISILLVVSCFALFAQTQEIRVDSYETARGVLSFDAGFVADYTGGTGFSAFIKSISYVAGSPFYYGFGSLLGNFSNTKESFFETGIMVGYTKDIADTNLYYDLFLDFLITGGRIAGDTSLYQGEAPALHLGFSLGFPASSNIDGALSIAPVIRPYSMKSGAWDFSRSYINLSLTLHFKSLSYGKKMPWAEAKSLHTLKGGKV